MDMLLRMSENRTDFNLVKGKRNKYIDLRSSTLNEGRINSTHRAARKLLNQSFQWPQESLRGVIIAKEVKRPFYSGYGWAWPRTLLDSELIITNSAAQEVSMTSALPSFIWPSLTPAPGVASPRRVIKS